MIGADSNFDAFVDEAATCGRQLDMTIVRPGTLLALNAVADDRQAPKRDRAWARRTLGMACAAIDHAKAALDGGESLLCCACDGELHEMPPVFAVVAPDRHAPKNLLAVGLCAACAPEHATEEPAKQAGAVALERRMGGIARRLDQHAPGHA